MPSSPISIAARAAAGITKRPPGATPNGLSRIIYIIVGLAALYGLTLFKPITEERVTTTRV